MDYIKLALRTILGVLLLTFLVSYQWREYRTIAALNEQAEQRNSVPLIKEDVPAPPLELTETKIITKEKNFSLPKAAQLEVPFTPQAPHANWDMPYQEACEEASLLMVATYVLRGHGNTIDPDKADEALLALLDWQREQSLPVSISTRQVAAVAEQYYGLEADISTEVTVEVIKRAIANGNPVIVPTAGKMLQNPHFRGGGPWYHMLVITGYDEEDFITNDPGTGFGKDYRYPHHFLLNAIHDWTGDPELIHLNPKIMIILKEPRKDSRDLL